jgi:putative peptidoglycan lipid II flippase
MMARTMSQVLFPAMAEAGGRKDATSLKRQTDTVTRGLVISMVGVFGALALTSPLILDIFFGNRYADASEVLPVLLLAVMFTTLPVASVNRLNSTGTAGARFVSIVAACGLLLAIALWLLLAPAMGTNGIAVGYLIATIGTAALPIIRTARLDTQRWGTLFVRMIAGLILITAGITYTWLGDPPHWVGLTFALVFLTLWLLINLKDVRSLRPRREAEGDQAEASDASDALGM